MGASQQSKSETFLCGLKDFWWRSFYWIRWQWRRISMEWCDHAVDTAVLSLNLHFMFITRIQTLKKIITKKVKLEQIQSFLCVFRFVDIICYTSITSSFWPNSQLSLSGVKGQQSAVNGVYQRPDRSRTEFENTKLRLDIKLKQTSHLLASAQLLCVACKRSLIKNNATQRQAPGRLLKFSHI